VKLNELDFSTPSLHKSQCYIFPLFALVNHVIAVLLFNYLFQNYWVIITPQIHKIITQTTIRFMYLLLFNKKRVEATITGTERFLISALSAATASTAKMNIKRLEVRSKAGRDGKI
jgi:hypothetical protein